MSCVLRRVTRTQRTAPRAHLVPALGHLLLIDVHLPRQNEALDDILAVLGREVAADVVEAPPPLHTHPCLVTACTMQRAHQCETTFSPLCKAEHVKAGVRKMVLSLGLCTATLLPRARDRRHPHLAIGPSWSCRSTRLAPEGQKMCARRGRARQGAGEPGHASQPGRQRRCVWALSDRVFMHDGVQSVATARWRSECGNCSAWMPVSLGRDGM